MTHTITSLIISRNTSVSPYDWPFGIIGYWNAYITCLMGAAYKNLSAKSDFSQMHPSEQIWIWFDWIWTVAYLECGKGGGGPGGQKSPSGIQGQNPRRGLHPPEADTFFVNECTNFDVLEEQISKTVLMCKCIKYTYLHGIYIFTYTYIARYN